jgi:hypothetical protein
MNTAPPPDTQNRPAITCDWEEWRAYLENVDATEDDKRQMIEALWSIVIAFVDLGWDVSGTSKESCGQSLDLKAALEAAVLNSNEQKIKEEV